MKELESQAAKPLAVQRLEGSVLRTLLYADLFRYPLKPEEISKRCDQSDSDLDSVILCLSGLKERGLVGELEGYYFLGEESGKVGRRKKGNLLAEKRLRRARKVSRFIAKFPFVRAVMLSGSLSKDYMEDDSDIDYFIVTEPERLWIARTFLILYKKLFLLNSHRDFCVNYFIDTSHLEIEDKNLFTATEVVTLIPTCNASIYEAFRAENQWADEAYPNIGLRDVEPCSALPSSWWGRSAEWMLKGRFGERLDNWCLRQTLGRWRSKFPEFTEERFEVALRSKKYVSKHHPSHFQDKVIKGFQSRIAAFEAEHGVKL